MLFINNPEARTAIIEQSRRDHGQRHADSMQEPPSSPTRRRSRSRTSLRFMPRPEAAS